MTIDKKMLDALEDNWFLRNDNNGVSYGGFRIAPVGEWNVCPKWNKDTKADCTSGGFFGQGPGGYGFAKRDNRLTFCETRGRRISIDGDKIKVHEFRVIYIDADALEAALYKTSRRWPGSLYLRGVTLPQGFTVGDVGGSLYLRGVTLPQGFTVGNVGGSLDLQGATIPEGFIVGNVGGWLDLQGATIPEGFTLGNVGGWLDLRGVTLPQGFTVGDVGGWLYLQGATLPECKTEQEIQAKIRRIPRLDKS